MYTVAYVGFAVIQAALSLALVATERFLQQQEALHAV